MSRPWCVGEMTIVVAKELNIGLESICFIDDNPIERDKVKNKSTILYLKSIFNLSGSLYQL